MLLASHLVWKLLKMLHLNFWILAFFTNFYPIKTDLSGNTVRPQTSGFQKIAQMNHFWHIPLTFVHSKCKRSSLRSQCWMRPLLWFLNTLFLLFVIFWCLWWPKKLCRLIWGYFLVSWVLSSLVVTLIQSLSRDQFSDKKRKETANPPDRRKSKRQKNSNEIAFVTSIVLWKLDSKY